MQKTLLKALFTSLITYFYSISGYAVTLDEAIRLTLTTNPDVRIRINQRLAREQELEQARGNLRPTLDLSGAIGRERSDNTSTRSLGSKDISLTRREIELRASQLIFDGFGTRFEVERNKARVEELGHRVLAASERTALSAIEVYLAIIRQQELLKLSQENLQAHLGIYEQIKSRSRSGVGRKSDLDQIESRVALAEANVRADEFNLRDAETDYLQVVDETPANLTQPRPPTNALPASIDEAVELATNNHPTLKAAAADIEAAKAQHQAAKNNNYPQFLLEANAGFGRHLDGLKDEDDDEVNLLLKARWNLYRGGRDNARILETAILSEEAREIRNRAVREAIQSARLSWVAHEAAQARLPLLYKRVEAAKRTRDVYKQQFDIGRRTLLDLLDTENESTQAQRDYLIADIDGLFAQYRILASVGRLLEALSIAPPAEVESLQAAAQKQTGRVQDNASSREEAVLAARSHKVDKDLSLLFLQPSPSTLSSLLDKPDTGSIRLYQLASNM